MDKRRHKVLRIGCRYYDVFVSHAFSRGCFCNVWPFNFVRLSIFFHTNPVAMQADYWPVHNNLSSHVEEDTFRSISIQTVFQPCQ